MVTVFPLWGTRWWVGGNQICTSHWLTGGNELLPWEKKKISVGRGLLLFRGWQLGWPAKKSEAASVSPTHLWRNRPKAKRGLWSLGVWFISVNSSSSFLNYVKILWIQTSCLFWCSYLIALWESSNNHSAAKHCKDTKSCESSSVLKLEHLMFSSVKNTNFPEMPHSCLHLVQQRVNLKCNVLSRLWL